MSINRLNPAACNNSLEIAPALANVNFDFSLWKVEAPKEFRDVGTHLSTFRREQAETGQAHMTARRLGALFESILPSTPNLRRCYGQRASEICQVSALSPETRKKYGMFSDRVGSDATSIWAAATSGSAAIAVHLLACLLARMFDDSAAVAIWEEIVSRRKDAIQASFDETDQVELSALQATRQTIGMVQLAEWDASARAWLRVADQVKSRQHTQLKLVLESVNLPVNNTPDTYDSVIQAWRTCLNDVEHLLQGRPQQANRGDTLLAISAWHLYPDLIVVTTSSKHIAQHDPLFQKQGLLTVGLEPRDDHINGISWSLPLKYLHYYGDPITRTGSHNLTERSRLSVDEFWLVILGCLIAGDFQSLRLADIIRCFSFIAKTVHAQVDAGSWKARALVKGPAENSWLNRIFKAVDYFENSVDDDRAIAEKLILLGRRYERSFLRVPPGPLFGLMSRGRFVGMLAEEEDRIEYLRQVALAHFTPNEWDRVIIKYTHSIEDENFITWELASAIARPWGSSGVKHYRYPDLMQIQVLSDEHEYVGQIDERHTVQLNHKLLNKNGYLSSRNSHACSRGEYTDYRYSFGNHWRDGDTMSIKVSDGTSSPPWGDKTYRYWYGDMRSAALWVEDDYSHLEPARKSCSKDLLEFLDSGKCKPANIVNLIADRLYATSIAPSQYFLDLFTHSLKGVATISHLYSTFEGERINVEVFSRRLCDSEWLMDVEIRYPRGYFAKVSRISNHVYDVPQHIMSYVKNIGLPYALDRRSAFACVAYVETGKDYLGGRDLSEVMAISFEDSLYISAALIRDPSPQSLETSDIIRVQGNIGRAGLSFMVPPDVPLVRRVAISEWPSLSEKEVDDNLVDTFNGTSVQISFTEASIPLQLTVGSRIESAHMVETLISVYDNGKWVADLNPWKAANQSLVSYLFPCKDQYEHADEEDSHGLVSIDNWLQLIDNTPSSVAKIMQTKGNTQARFATMCLAAYLGMRTLVLPENLCWRCLRTKLQLDQDWLDELEYTPLVLIA